MYDTVWGTTNATGNFMAPSANPYLGMDEDTPSLRGTTFRRTSRWTLFHSQGTRGREYRRGCRARWTWANNKSRTKTSSQLLWQKVKALEFLNSNENNQKMFIKFKHPMRVAYVMEILSPWLYSMYTTLLCGREHVFGSFLLLCGRWHLFDIS